MLLDIMIQEEMERIAEDGQPKDHILTSPTKQYPSNYRVLEIRG